MSVGEIIAILAGVASLVVLIVLSNIVKKSLSEERENRQRFEEKVLSTIASAKSGDSTKELEALLKSHLIAKTGDDAPAATSSVGASALPAVSSEKSLPAVSSEKSAEPDGSSSESNEGASGTPTGAQLDDLKKVLSSLDVVLTQLSTQLMEQNRSSHQETLKYLANVQARIIELIATDKFMALLEDPKDQQRALLSSIRRIGDDDMVARLAIAYPSQGALSILQDIAVSGKGNELVGWALLGVADKQKEAGMLEQAETFYKQALSALENSLGSVNDDVAEILESLASIAIMQGRAIEAEEFLARCGEVRSKLLGTEHSKVAESSIQLGDLYISQERYQEARPLFERALEISRKVLGPTDEQCMSLLQKLAHLHETLEEPIDAARVYEQICELQNGDELSETLKHLIPIYETTSNWPQLESVYRRLIVLCDGSDPAIQFQRMEYLRNLARSLKRQEKQAEATQVLMTALEETEGLLGGSHDDVISVVDELSDRLIEEDKLKAAAPYVMRAFHSSLSNTESDRFRRILGKVKLLAEKLILEKEFDVAEDMYQQALTAMEKQKEPPKKAIIGLLRKIGALCAQIEDYEKSEAALRRAVRITELLFGFDHPETLNLLMQLGHLLQKAGKLQESEALYKRVLEMRYKIHGESHADIVESLVELAKLCKLQNNATEAEIYEESAVEMATAIYGTEAPQLEEISQSLANLSVEMSPGV